MPANLQAAILKLPTDVVRIFAHVLKFPRRPNSKFMNILLKIEKNIWVSCMDMDNMNVTLEYDTHIGFPTFYFPYANQAGYLTPFVAMQIDNLPGNVIIYQRRLYLSIPTDTFPFSFSWILNPRLTVGFTVKISCRLWAKNIVVDRQRRLGMTNLEVLSNA